VSAIQSKGDVGATLAGGALGAAGELAGPALKGITSLLGTKVPNLSNFSQSFGGATPTQKGVITKLLPTFVKDGIKPEGSALEMQASIKNKLADLGKQYDAVPTDVATRTTPVDTITDDLKKQQGKFINGTQTVSKEVPTGLFDNSGNALTKTQNVDSPFVSTANKPYYNKIQDEIDDITKKASSQNGDLTYKDLRYMRDGANGRTNFASPDADKSIYKGIGNAYRGGMDSLYPEGTQLNRDFAKYKQAEDMIDMNVDRGKGSTPSGLDFLQSKMGQRLEGSTLGGTLGYHVAGAPGALLGTLIGGAVGPKLAKPTMQAMRNASDSGVLQRLAAPTLNALRSAIKAGKDSTVLSLLSKSSEQEMTRRGITGEE
jgi:hypothetical protein